MIIYIHPKCTTCKKALQFLKEHRISFTQKNILETSPSMPELKKMLHFKKGSLKKLFNTSGQLYREMELSKKVEEMSEQEALTLLHQEGMLVKRPFVLSDTFGLLGFDESEWKSYLI